MDEGPRDNRRKRNAFVYAVKLGAVAVITGDVGSGKSSALRFASGRYTPRNIEYSM